MAIRARWTVQAGRLIVYDGVPQFTVHAARPDGLSDPRPGMDYNPAELDSLTHRIAAALNVRAVAGMPKVKR